MNRRIGLPPWSISLAAAGALAAFGFFAHRSLRPLNVEMQPQASYAWLQLVVLAAGCLAVFAVHRGIASGRRPGIAWASAALLLAGTACLVAHWWLWSQYTLWLSNLNYRVFRSYEYESAVVERWEEQDRQGAPRTPVDELIQTWAAYHPEYIFTERSRQHLPLLLLGSWVAGCISLVIGSSLLLKFLEEEPAIREVRAALAPLSPRLPAHFCEEFQRAANTLSSAGNVKGTIVSVAALFSGPCGLLTEAVAPRRGELAARMASWNDKETKDLRRKYEKQGFGALDFLEQIEIVRLSGLASDAIASDLHWIRKRGNDARHNNSASMSRADAIKALQFAVDIARWYGEMPAPADQHIP
jgi:hypothetical protein